MKAHVGRVRSGHAVHFAAATVAALALVALGFAEIAWMPFFFVAVSATTRGGCLAPFLRKAAAR